MYPFSIRVFPSLLRSWIPRLRWSAIAWYSNRDGTDSKFSIRGHIDLNVRQNGRGIDIGHVLPRPGSNVLAVDVLVRRCVGWAVNCVSNRFIEFSSLPRVAKSTGRAERCALVIVGVTKGIICSDDNATSAELYLYLRCTKQKSEWGEMGHSKRCEGQQGKKDSLDRIWDGHWRSGSKTIMPTTQETETQEKDNKG